MYACAICGKLTVGDERWLLMVENRWQDRLKILHWDSPLAPLKGVKVVCSAAHARELVVHWMTTGSLAYPFAQLTRVAQKDRRNSRSTNVDRFLAEGQEVNTGSARPLGELAIHRESLRRVLADNPQALSGILETLLKAVEAGIGTMEPALKRREHQLSLVPSVV